MKIVIVTGMSGAGKSSAINYLEDIGYYCIDNMPPELLLTFSKSVFGSDKLVDKLAVSIDIRSGELFSRFEDCVNALKLPNADVCVLYLDASDDTLVKRYKETRRKHPLDAESFGNLYEAISLERKLTNMARELADYCIDTSDFGMADFRAEMGEYFSDNGVSLSVSVVSFGFKHGIPKDADLVFDVRCLPNPYYIEELKHKTGLDGEVYDYVMSFDESGEVFSRIFSFVSYMLPLYEREGRTRIVIAFGCTGGRHRSVSFARRLSDALNEAGFCAHTEHRALRERS